MFGDVRHKQSLIFLLSIKDPDVLKQKIFTGQGIIILLNLAVEKLHRQRILKEHFDVSLKE